MPELIERAKSRAQAERLEVSFEVGDAEHLSYADASFDVVPALVVSYSPEECVEVEFSELRPQGVLRSWGHCPAPLLVA
jgi:2-polyprenyl-3-methyl-5-hydroxy-6-metoxy-1,4-benzoquinol methylase